MSRGVSLHFLPHGREERYVQTLKGVSTIHILVNMKNSSSQFKRAKSLGDGGTNAVDEEFPLHNFVKAKEEINVTFRNLKKYLEDCKKFLAGSRIADENEQDIERFSREVRLSNVTFKLHDIDENWQIKNFLTGTDHITLWLFFNVFLFTFTSKLL